MCCGPLCWNARTRGWLGVWHAPEHCHAQRGSQLVLRGICRRPTIRSSSACAARVLLRQRARTLQHVLLAVQLATRCNGLEYSARRVRRRCSPRRSRRRSAGRAARSRVRAPLPSRPARTSRPARRAPASPGRALSAGARSDPLLVSGRRIGLGVALRSEMAASCLRLWPVMEPPSQQGSGGCLQACGCVLFCAVDPRPLLHPWWRGILANRAYQRRPPLMQLEDVHASLLTCVYCSHVG